MKPASIAGFLFGVHNAMVCNVALADAILVCVASQMNWPCKPSRRQADNDQTSVKGPPRRSEIHGIEGAASSSWAAE